MREKLTSRERFELLLIDEQPDRVVTFPLVTAHAVEVLGCTVADYCRDGEILAKAQIAAWELYGQDALGIFTGSGLIAHGFGSKFLIRDEDIPILIEPVLKNSEDVEDLIIPDPYANGMMKVYLDAIDYCYESVGDRVPIIAFIPAPFTTAAQVRGISQFLKDTLKNTGFADRLLEICTEASIRFTDACMEHGALPMIVDPLASCSVVSPRAFKQFALPGLRKLNDFMHRYDLDTMLHICGETSQIIEMIPDTATELFSFDKTCCGEVKDSIGNEVRLVGNISPQDMLFSSPDEIRLKVRNAIEIMLDSPKGCVISTGCELPIKTPKENVIAFIETAKEIGKIW